jgi:predicted neutral ceramidase superfamily lipid hydrolase
MAVGQVSGKAYSGGMAWSEELKAKGRAELVKRMGFETASTYRAVFLKWFGWMVFCILMNILFAAMFFQQQNWLLRASDIIFFVAMLVGLVISGSLFHVRFLDWRRATATERNVSIA